MIITFVQFIVLGLSLAAPVGPMNIEVMRRGLSQGLLASWLVGLGGITGDSLLLLSIYFGFAQFMELFIVKLLMYAIGVVMLGYLGWESLRSSLARDHSFLTAAPDDDKTSTRGAFMAGFILALANPINLVFWFGVYGTSLQSLTSNHSMWFSLVCSFAIILGLFLWNLNVVFTVHFSRQLMRPWLVRSITFAAGASLMGFSVHFMILLFRLLT